MARKKDSSADVLWEGTCSVSRVDRSSAQIVDPFLFQAPLIELLTVSLPPLDWDDKEQLGKERKRPHTSVHGATDVFHVLVVEGFPCYLPALFDGFKKALG